MISKIDKAEFLTILEKHRGLVTYAIREAGIARQTYYNWLEKDEEFKEKVDVINEAVIDWCESKLYDKVDDKDAQSIFFVLKAKAKKRGYGDDKFEVKHNVDFTPIKIIFGNDDSETGNNT